MRISDWSSDVCSADLAAHQHPRRTRAVEPMTVASSKWMLAAIWLVGAGGVFLLLVAQSLLGRYEPATHEVWGWFLPTVMPTLSLIVGVLVADRRSDGKGQDARQAGKPVADQNGGAPQRERGCP